MNDLCPPTLAASARDDFLSLLGEQVYQKYLEQNTRFIPREFVQNHGIHFDLILRKLAFGADYVSDFFYMSSRLLKKVLALAREA
jgi:hypothetical protein